MISQTQLNTLLEKRQVRWDVHPGEQRRIPRNQPVILLANRLVEGVDELLLASLFNELEATYQIQPTFFLPSSQNDPSGLRGLPDLLERIRTGDTYRHVLEGLQHRTDEQESLGILMDFAGGRLLEKIRSRGLNRLLQALLEYQIPIVPLRLDLLSDHALPAAGARLLQRLRPGPLQIRVRVGAPISVADQSQFEQVDTFRRYVQSRIFALGSDLEVRSFFWRNFRERLKESTEEEAIAAPIDPALIEEEIQQLSYRHLIASQSNFDILVAQATEIPNTLQEIGRLRELTFRQVGEGTGKARDIDEYDLYYHQLLIWDREAKQIVGGYRMGKGDEIYAKMGMEGFYIHSLFEIKPGFVPIMKRSVELGRSYVRPEYQRKRLPLFLLWKGILFFLLKNPQYQYLYGPMSISKYYSDLSKSMIVAFIKKYYFNPYLGAFLKPRKPFRAKVENIDLDVVMDSLGDEIRQLDSLIEDIEPEHFKVPVLMRQYIKLNARFISFNVDPNFSDVLDGFIILDLKDVPYSMIEALKKEV